MNSTLPKIRSLLDHAAEDIRLARKAWDERLQAATEAQVDIKKLLGRSALSFPWRKASRKVFGAGDKGYGIVHATAHEAIVRHVGLFASMEMERLLHLPIKDDVKSVNVTGADASRLRVLHICSLVHSIGGHTRAVQRWIENDRESTHSVALAWQNDLPIPQELKVVVSGSGGQLHSWGRSTVVQVARRLRALARTSDLIVLHVHPEDLVPILSFATMDERPPIALFNHGDHLFGAGVSIADTVIDLRPAGQRLSVTRRGVRPSSSVLLPSPLLPAVRSRSRSEAKSALGIASDQIVLLSIGAPYKYAPIGELDFVEAHLPLLKEFPQCLLVVVGTSPETPYWQHWGRETGGRVRAVTPRPDLTAYHEAADIYLDSIPFGSNTALLEAVLYGTPAVSWEAFPPEFGASILRSNDIALISHPFAFAEHDRYLTHIRELIRRQEFRLHMGSEMSLSVEAVHGRVAFSQNAQKVYAATLSAMKLRTPSQEIPADQLDGVDLALSTFLANQRSVLATS